MVSTIPLLPVSSRSGVILCGCGSQETWEMSRRVGKTQWSITLVLSPSFAWAPHRFWVEPWAWGPSASRPVDVSMGYRTQFWASHPPEVYFRHPSGVWTCRTKQTQLLRMCIFGFFPPRFSLSPLWVTLLLLETLKFSWNTSGTSHILGHGYSGVNVHCFCCFMD